MKKRAVVNKGRKRPGGGGGGGGGKSGRPVIPKKPSTVYFVGAGPGDPGLMTIKGAKALKEADVLVYAGSLVRDKLLQYCRKDARIHNSASMDLESIMSVIVRAAREGKRVVRLHSGDPTLYSALGEQAEVLEREGIPYEVIPGVSSAFAAAAALKKELTVPELTQTVIFTRLTGRTSVPEAERLSSLASHNATICVFLSASMIEKVVEELMKGYTPDTPAAVVYRASWEDEVIIRGTLSDIAGKSKGAGIKRHALIMAGGALAEGGVLEKASRLYDRGFSHSYRRG